MGDRIEKLRVSLQDACVCSAVEIDNKSIEIDLIDCGG